MPERKIEKHKESNANNSETRNAEQEKTTLCGRFWVVSGILPSAIKTNCGCCGQVAEKGDERPYLAVHKSWLLGRCWDNCPKSWVPWALPYWMEEDLLIVIDWNKPVKNRSALTMKHTDERTSLIPRPHRLRSSAKSNCMSSAGSCIRPGMLRLQCFTTLWEIYSTFEILHTETSDKLNSYD